ncbi:EAL domain-containing protein [Terrihabitans sp. PJ23]|uniref:EAL domain-containing protein n=1 Tax=Terrihabitans rhizophilus TaxID=3092662 RepID=A0ABU4RI89_9HYPH|nr:EAL domain-containing protein [Terrihabitans sp. PJ23]
MMSLRRGNSLRAFQWGLAAVVCCLAAALFYVGAVTLERQSALQKVSRYNSAWTVSQMVAEFMRLEHTIARFAVPGSGVDLTEVQLRLDVMFSRLQTFEANGSAETGNGRSLRNFVRSDPQNLEFLTDLRAALTVVDDLITVYGFGPGDVDKALRALKPLDAQLTAIASRANAFGAERAAEDRGEMQRLNTISSLLAAAIIVCGLILVALLVSHNRRLKIAHQRLEDATTDLEATTKRLQVQNTRFDAALNNMSQALCTFDANNHLAVYNQRFAALTGLPKDLLEGASASRIIDAARARQMHAAFADLYPRQNALINERRAGTFTLEIEDGRAFSVSHEPLEGGGWLATYEDVTERRRIEAQLAHMAHHDPLTDLPNRALFQERLRSVFAGLQSDPCDVLVFFLDLDGFKDVNDTLGHHVGDELLKVVAERLKSCIVKEHLAARLGGDEFAVVCTFPAGEENGTALADSLLSSLSRPYVIGSREIEIGVSLGASRHPGASNTAEELLQHADIALYQAKADGKGLARFFQPEMDAYLKARKALESDLRKAVDRGEMDVHYQPFLITETGEISGYEALLRWNHPERGQISPAEFIPIAEEAGIINSLGNWVLRHACREAAGWQPHLIVAVNLSPVQFKSDGLLDTVVMALAAAGLPANRLEIEITESVLLDSGERVSSALRQLRGLGVRVAMDDFGTGYSSLATLRSFPFDKIKIDRSFIRDLDTRPDALSVVRLIVGLGESLGMSTTAEGVETQQQLECLRIAGCTHVQGFLFARPRPSSDLVASLAAETPGQPLRAIAN